MTTTLTLADPAQARVGDVLTAIDGIQLRPMAIDRKPVAEGQTTILHLETPQGSVIEWQRYLEPGQKVTVERDEPQVTVRYTTLSDLLTKALAPRGATTYPRRLTRHGVRLVQEHKGEQCYFTEDRRYEIQYDEGYMTECEGPHPVRYSAEAARQATDAAYYEECRRAGRGHIFPDVRWKIAADLRAGRNGYLCPGGAEHQYGMWELSDLTGPNGTFVDVIDRGESMRDMLASLPAEYGYHSR